MPIYAYQCTACGHELESLQRLSDARLVTCPECKADTLIKQVTAAGFQLKGSGWYVTDFRNKASAPDKKTDSTPAATDKPAGEAKPDATATPAAKAETTTTAPVSTPAPASTPTTGSAS